jgi:aryl-alcohol dehydrogenase-like predicted oxidoreductase
VPIARWAITWCVQHPDVSAAIAGSRTIEQLEGNAAAAELLLVCDDHPFAVVR